jgi:hypothetical protein
MAESMKDAKELFELALFSHRRMEKLTLIEKGAVISIVNALFQAEVQETQVALAEEKRRLASPLNAQQQYTPQVGDEYQQ